MPWITGQVRIGSEGDWESGWINTETGEQRSGSAPEFLGGGAPEGATDSNAHYLSIWNSLPGSDIERFRAMSAQGLGHSGVLQFLIDNNLASPEILNSGEVTALMQERQRNADDRGMFPGTNIPNWAVFGGLVGGGILAGAPAAAGGAAGAGAGVYGGLDGAAIAGADFTAAGALGTGAGVGAAGAAGGAGFTVDPVTGDTVLGGGVGGAGDPGFIVNPVTGDTVAGGAVGTGVGTAAGTTAGTTAGSALGTGIGTGVGTALGNGLGDLIGGGLGILGAERYINYLEGESRRNREERAPYLAASTNYLNDPSAYINGPGQAGLQGVLRGLSTRGNPIGNPASLEIATHSAMNDWRNAVTGFGNMGLSGSDTRSGLATNIAGAQAGQFGSLGYGLAGLVGQQPRPSSGGGLGSLV